MVNDKYVVKYLDPRTGKYEYATIKDVGDLQKLNTKVKTSIVDAINSISTDGIGGLRDDLNAIGETIKSLEDGTLELGDFQSIDDVVSREIEDAINSLKLENSGLLQLTQEEINKIVSNAESEYRDNIATSIRELETSKTDLVAAREKMITIGKMLENANIDYSNLTQVVDSINLYITDIIEKTDFDMVNGIVSDYKTAVTQTQDGWGVDASKNMLSYLTGRVKSNETSLNVQHGLIEAKVGKDEFQYMTVDNLPAGKENMLHNTFDLRDWGFSSAFIFKSADDYRFTSIVQADSAGENITGTTDELEQGVTYAISTYVNVQNKNKEPGQEKYAPTDGLYTATVIIDGDTIELNNVVEDNSALDGWKRVSGTFIAKRTAKQDIKFYVTAFNRDTQVGYLSAPKFEKGSSATSWVPHIEDNVSTMLSQNAVMRVLSDRITSSVEEVRETKDAFETATSTFDQMADGFELNTNKLTEVLDKYGEVTGVQTQQASELKVLNESITSKVWKQDINTTIDTINIDTSNRIVNSAFNIYNYDELTGALKLDYWDNNTGFAIKKHSQSLDNYLYAKRSNATSVNPISIKSSPFALRDGEKILFNFEYLAVGNPLDNDNVFTLEMYDNNDVRVGLQEFRLSELKKEFLTAYDVGDSYKYNGTYIVKNSSVVKGTITLKLPKNGELWLTKVMLQNAGIGTIGWTPSSVDNQIIQSKLSTEINQLADSIELVATDERLDAINGLLVKKDGKVVISPEAIISRVTSQELGEKGLITQTSLKQTEDNLRFDLVDKDGIIQTINASAEGLLIDFDKVYIDGEVIARMISAQAIDVTQGFRLTDNNGNTLLAVVNDNGTPTLSITKEFRIKFGEVNDKLDVTIVGVVEEYYYSVDPDELIGGRWTSTPDVYNRGDNRFIWKRTKLIYQSGDVGYYPSETGVNITGSWEYEKESVTAEVVKALNSAEDAKALAVSEANQAMIDANKYADAQDALITQQVTTSVSNAISTADQAKQVATDSYNNAVAEAERLTSAQSEAFNKKFEANASEMNSLSQATKDADTKAQSALIKAGVNANLLTTHQNTLNTINNTTIPNVNKIATDAMAEAKSALTSASSAMTEAKKADGKIADYVTRNGLVNGTTVDSKIDTATGEISKKITTVESKIDGLQVGGRNYFKGYKFNEDIAIYNYNNVGSFRQFYKRLTYPLEESNGKTFTISFEAISPNGDTLISVYNSNGYPKHFRFKSDSIGTVTTTWKKFKTTVKVVSEDVTNSTDYNRIEIYAPSQLGVKIRNIKVELGNIATDWTPAPEDNYTQEEFKIFESTYKEDVKGINSSLTELTNKKLDGSTYTTFYNNEYKKTAQGVTDTYAKVNKIIDTNGNSTDAFAKAVYDRNATRQSADFKSVTDGLVKTATYEAGINGINTSISEVEGKIPTYVGGRNLIVRNTLSNGYITSNGEFYTSSGDANRSTDWIDISGVKELTFTTYDKFEGANSGRVLLYASKNTSDFISYHADYNSSTPIQSYTIKVPENAKYARATVIYGETLRYKLEKGNVSTDWTPAPEDMLGKETFTLFKNDYDETAEEVSRRLTAIDSSASGSVVTRLNKTESTANGNSTLISTINKNYVKQSNIDASILADKKIKDTRSTNQLPSWYFANYPSQEVREFKQVSTMGVGSGSYGILTTNVPWTSTSGGVVRQSFETNAGTYIRQGTANASAWYAWSKQIDTSDTTYQKVTQTSALYERILGSTENGLKTNISGIVQTSEIIQQTVTSAMNVENRNLLVTKNSKNDTWLVGSETYPNPSVATNSGTSTSPDLIAVSAGDKFTLSKNETTLFFRVSFLDSSKKYLGRYTQNAKSAVITPPANTAYLWVSYPHNAEAKVEKGSIYTGYSPAPEDTATQSHITQLADNINLKVSKGDISNQININAQGVVIDGKKISLSGQTSVDGAFWAKEVNAVKVKANNISGTTAEFKTMVTKGLTADVISSTMIKADTALFDMLFSTTSATTRLVARGAWITNANIVSLDASKITAGTINSARINATQIVTNGLSANVVKSTHIESSTALVDKVFATTALINQLTSKTAFINSIKAIEISASKITSGTLDASKVTVTNLDANNITANKTSFVQSVWNSLESSISINSTGLLSKASDGSQVYLQNGVVGARNPSGATIGQVGYAYESSSPWYSMQVSHGSHFQIRMSRGDGELNKQAFYIISGGTESYLNTDNIYLNPSASGRVRVQGDMAIDKNLSVGNEISGTNKLRFAKGAYLEEQSNGNVQLKSAGTQLQFYQASGRIMYSDGTRLFLDLAINMQGNGVLNQSDARIKTDIRKIEQDSLSIIKGTDFVNYKMISNGRETFGFIAQQMKKVAPHLIKDEDGTLAFDSMEWTQTVAHGLQQLNNKVDENDNKMNNKIKELENKITMLELELKIVRG